MKKNVLTLTVLLVLSTSLFAGTRNMTLGGVTGAIVTPNALMPFGSADTSVDFGMHYLSDGESIIPKATLALFNRWEIGGSYDIQGNQSNDLILHSKLKFAPWSGEGNSTLAIGGNLQQLNGPDDSAFQLYLVATYVGAFFNMPAVTSIVFGTTDFSNNVDFAMSFDLDFIPSVFGGFLHLVTDFSNFSYSLHARGAQSNRGIFNSGVRISILRDHQRFKLNIDILGLDLLDSNRSMATGLVFGLAL